MARLIVCSLFFFISCGGADLVVSPPDGGVGSGGGGSAPDAGADASACPPINTIDGGEVSCQR